MEKWTQFCPDSLIHQMPMERTAGFLKIHFPVLYISVGVVPVRVEFGYRRQMWVEQCLCVQTQSPLCTDRWLPPHITIGVPTCLIGNELVYNILTFRCCFGDAFRMFSWLIFGHMFNKWMEKSDSILSQTAVCLVRDWIS